LSKNSNKPKRKFDKNINYEINSNLKKRKRNYEDGYLRILKSRKIIKKSVILSLKNFFRVKNTDFEFFNRLKINLRVQNGKFIDKEFPCNNNSIKKSIAINW